MKRVRRGLSPAWCSSSFDKVGLDLGLGLGLGLGKLGCPLGLSGIVLGVGKGDRKGVDCVSLHQ